MASDTRNVKLGTCKIFYDGVDLGYTQGGVEVTVTTETHDVNVDQFGKSLINETIVGRNVMAKVPMAETTLQNLVKIMPGATLVNETGGGVRVDVPTAVGTSLLSIAKQLVLHPQELALTDTSMDFVIPRASTAGAINFTYKTDAERLFPVEFKGYPDPTTNLLFHVGGTLAADEVPANGAGPSANS